MLSTLFLVLILYPLAKCVSNCDPDGSITVYVDPMNPYCTKLSATDCTCCGYSADNLYNYNSTCTIGTVSDTKSGETLQKKCDPNCESAGCTSGVCTNCKTLPQGNFYHLQINTGTVQDSCVPKCEAFKGVFGKQDAITGYNLCSQCPTKCTTCSLSNNCQECNYNQTRWLNGEEKFLTNKTFDGKLSCSLHSNRVALDPTDSNFTRTYYISPNTSFDCNLVNCDGSFDQPYNNINFVFQDLIENVKIGEKTRLKVEIYLLKNDSITEHYWYENSSLPSHYMRLFERTLVDGLIEPASCSDVGKCFGANEKATIYVKSNLISLFVTWKLSIKNIIFDGSELIPEGACFSSNKSSSLRCCQNTEDLPIKASNESDAICNPSLSSTPLLQPFLTYDPSKDVWPVGQYGFIVMQMMYDTTDTEIPELIIQNCEFNNFWYHRYAYSLIKLNNYGSRVTIDNTSFKNFYFSQGLISNVQESIERDTLFTENSISNYDCSDINSNLTDCFSLKIENSKFINSLFGNYVFSNQINPNITTKSLSKNEGIVLFLNSFNGPILVKDNTFEKLASLFFSTQTPITCATAPSVTITNLYHNLDRLMQISLGHEKFGTVQSSSVMNIRNLMKGITLYNNTFRSNLALTGTNLFIHNFDNSENYSIIIEKNTFEKNMAQSFGSSFAIINYQRDYVTMNCKGIYMKANVFTENIMCPYAAGNAIIACIPEKESLSPFFSGETVDTTEGSSWVTYYPSVNQNKDSAQADYNTITQLVFTKFVQNITSNKDIPKMGTHPITGDSIDLSRIQVIANNFTKNYASLAQLYLQGAQSINLNLNNFQSNTFPFTILYPASLTSIAIFSKVIAGQEDGYFVSSAAMLRLINYANIENNQFINNQQVATTSPGLTLGTALSIDRHLGAAPINIYKNDFLSHAAPNYTEIRNLSSFKSSSKASATVTVLQRGATPPLITYSIWEKLEGVTYKDLGLNPAAINTAVKTSVTQSLFGEATLNISNCKFLENKFSKGVILESNFINAEGIVWHFKDSHRETRVVTLIGNDDGQIVANTSLYITESTFISNSILDNRAMIRPTSSNFFYLTKNVFRYHSSLSDSTNDYAILKLIHTDVYQPTVFMSQNTFEYNTGRILHVTQTTIGPANKKSTFSNNTIRHHTSSSNIIFINSRDNVTITGTIAENITTTQTFLSVYAGKSEILIGNTSIQNLTTWERGCLSVDATDSGVEVSGLKCINSKLIVPKTISLNIRAVTPCFYVQNQASNRLNFAGFVCETPILSYEDSTQRHGSIYKAICYYFSKLNSIVIQGFSCNNVNLAAITDDPGLHLAYSTESNFVSLSNGTFLNNNIYRPVLQMYGKLAFGNMTIINNHVKAEAVFFYGEKARVQLDTILFDQNDCQSCQGSFKSYNGAIEAINSNFTNNIAAEAAIFNVKAGELRVSSCQFKKNKATLESSVITADSTITSVSNSHFEENQSEKHVITISDGQLSVAGCKFIDNKVTTAEPHDIRTYGAPVSISNTIFQVSQKPTNTIRGMFLMILRGSTIITGCTFINGFAQAGGSIFFELENNKVQIINCTFLQNTADLGGSIYVSGAGSGSDVFISKSTFEDNEANIFGGSVFIDAITSTIVNSTFLTPRGDTLYLSRSSHVLNNLTLKGVSQNLGRSSIGIISTQVRTLEITNCIFSEFNYDSADLATNPNFVSSSLIILPNGASNPVYKIKNATFERNKGRFGGGVYVQGDLKITIESSKFIGNEAEKGGGIFYDTALNTSFFNLTGNCSFINNKATASGGAVQFTGRKVYFDASKTVLSGNSAPYGNDFGAYGVYIVAKPYDPAIAEAYKIYAQNLLFTQRLLQANQTLYTGNDSYLSGFIMDPPVMYELKDEFGVTITADSSSRIQITVGKAGNGTARVLYEGDDIYRAYNGYFVLYPLKVFVGPKSGVAISANLISFDPTKYGRTADEFPKVVNPLPTSVSSRECLYGERLTDVDICYLCPKGEYTLLKQDREACRLCPEEGFCESGNKYAPKANYWRYSLFDHKLNPCANEEACLGGLVFDENIRNKSYCPPGLLFNESFCAIGWCSEGYEGMLCAECNDGYAISSGSKLTCAKCSDNPVYYVVTGLLAVAGVIYITFLIKSAVKDEEKPPETSKADQNNSQTKKEGSKTYLEIKEKKEDNPNLIESQKESLQELEKNNKFVKNSKRKVKDVSNEEQDMEPLHQIRGQSSSLREINLEEDAETSKKNCDITDGIKSEPDRLLRNSKNQTASQLEEQPKRSTSVYSKILTTYIQLLSIIGSFDFEWPEPQTDFFKAQDTMSKGSAEVFSFGCFLKQSFIADMNLRPFFTKLFILAISPIILITIASFVWVMVFVIKYYKRFSSVKKRLKSNVITSFVVILFLLHPNIVDFSLQAFQCTPLGDDENTAYLNADPQIKCDTPRHEQLALSIALPSLVGWGVGIPFIAFVVLVLKRKQLADPNFKANLGFLYEGYTYRTFYWELIVSYRKLGLILIATFLNKDLNLQAAYVLGLSTVCYLLQVKVNPYETDSLNELEKRALIVSTFTLFFAMFYITGSLGLTAKLVLFILIIIINLYFLLYWGLEFLKAKAEELLEIPYIEKRFGNFLRKIIRFEVINDKRLYMWKAGVFGTKPIDEIEEKRNRLNLSQENQDDSFMGFSPVFNIDDDKSPITKSKTIKTAIRENGM